MSWQHFCVCVCVCACVCVCVCARVGAVRKYLPIDGRPFKLALHHSAYRQPLSAVMEINLFELLMNGHDLLLDFSRSQLQVVPAPGLGSGKCGVQIVDHCLGR